MCLSRKIDDCFCHVFGRATPKVIVLGRCGRRPCVELGKGTHQDLVTLLEVRQQAVLVVSVVRFREPKSRNLDICRAAHGGVSMDTRGPRSSGQEHDCNGSIRENDTVLHTVAFALQDVHEGQAAGVGIRNGLAPDLGDGVAQCWREASSAEHDKPQSSQQQSAMLRNTVTDPSIPVSPGRM